MLPLRLSSVLVALSLSVAAQATSSAPWLVRAADTSGEGDVSAEEWTSFVEMLSASADGMDRMAIMARAMYGKSEIRAADLNRVRTELDQNGDGALAGAEVIITRLDANAPGGDQLLGAIIASAADTNGDGSTSTDEWNALVSPLGETALSLETLAVWFQRAADTPNPAENRNAMTPGVVLLGFDALLDLDRDGTFSAADLQLHFGAFDRNGDGNVEAGELVRRTATRSGQWRIRNDVRNSPPLMPWQRNLDDALALVEATGKPLLICVNMDGEAASETLAWDRYRDPEFAGLAEGFVCLIVSPDRHTERDFDDQGRRVEDPRFGRVLSTEAISIENELYERYFNGRRVAPRHVGVAADGSPLFDIYLVQDLNIIADAMREHGKAIAPAEPSTEAALLASPDAAHRSRLESHFATGDERTRARLAGLALSSTRAVQHPQVLRQALRDGSSSVRGRAVWNVIQEIENTPPALLVDAFRAADQVQRRALASALQSSLTGEESPNTEQARRARLALAFHGALAPSRYLDVDRWRLVLGGHPKRSTPQPTAAEFDPLVNVIETLLAQLDSTPNDVALWTHLAAARMRFAQVNLSMGRDPRFFFEDVIASAGRAAELDPSNGRAHGYLAWANYLLANFEDAAQHSARALPLLFEDAGSDLSAAVLDVHAQSRMRAVYDAMGKGEAWDAAAVPEILAAYEALIAHPTGTHAQITGYLDFLGQIEDFGAQLRVAQREVDRDRTADPLHVYLRFFLLRDHGANALETAYEELVSACTEAEEASVTWHAGLASLLAAERHVQNGKNEEALAAYGRSTELLARAGELSPDFADSANHYAALAFAGRGGIRVRQGAFEDAASDLLGAVALRPATAEHNDGLGQSPAGRLRSLLRRLRASEQAELRERVAAVLSEHGLDG